LLLYIHQFILIKVWLYSYNNSINCYMLIIIRLILIKLYQFIRVIPYLNGLFIHCQFEVHSFNFKAVHFVFQVNHSIFSYFQASHFLYWLILYSFLIIPFLFVLNIVFPSQIWVFLILYILNFVSQFTYFPLTFSIIFILKVQLPFLFIVVL